MDTELAAQLRMEYSSKSLSESEAGDDPIALLQAWLDEAISAGIREPNAAALATADVNARPAVRMVLLRSIASDGAVFATNYESNKGRDLAQNPQAAFTIWWQPMFRQVRVTGSVQQLTKAENDEIFSERPRGAQIGAIASLQSHFVTDRAALDEQVDRVTQSLGDEPVARPEYWGGYRISFESVEFWQGRSNRLHDRLLFERRGDQWQRIRLQP